MKLPPENYRHPTDEECDNLPDGALCLDDQDIWQPMKRSGETVSYCFKKLYAVPIKPVAVVAARAVAGARPPGYAEPTDEDMEKMPDDALVVSTSGGWTAAASTRGRKARLPKSFYAVPIRQSDKVADPSRPDDLRAMGWSVAVHNDYRLNGVSHTFWLFTNGHFALKGEGLTDADALNQVREKVNRLGSALLAPVH